jgi:hypothetical protein
MSLYQEIVAAKIPHDHHESDLYVPDNTDTRQILDRHPMSKGNAKRFKDNVTKTTWIDIPFAYDPFWEAAAKAANHRANMKRTRT